MDIIANNRQKKRSITNVAFKNYPTRRKLLKDVKELREENKKSQK